MSMEPPYVVKLVSDASLGVEVGDELILATSDSVGKVHLRNMTWTDLVTKIKDRPITLWFERRATDEDGESPSALSLIAQDPPVFEPTVPPSNSLPSAIEPALEEQIPTPPSEGPIDDNPPLTQPSAHPLPSRSADNHFQVTFTSNGPLGMEFAQTSHPWLLESTKGQAASLGIQPGDKMSAIKKNTGNFEWVDTTNLSWSDVRDLLTERPVEVHFERGIACAEAEPASTRNFFGSSPDRSITPPFGIKLFSLFGPEDSPGSLAASPAIDFPTYQQSLTIDDGQLGSENEILRDQIERLETAISELELDKTNEIMELEAALVAANHSMASLRIDLEVQTQAVARANAAEERERVLLEKTRELRMENRKFQDVIYSLRMELEGKVLRITALLNERLETIERTRVVEGLSDFFGKRVSVPRAAMVKLAESFGLRREEISMVIPPPGPRLDDAFVAFLDGEAEKPGIGGK